MGKSRLLGRVRGAFGLNATESLEPRQDERHKNATRFWMGLGCGPWGEEPTAPEYMRIPLWVAGNEAFVQNVSTTEFPLVCNPWGEVRFFFIYLNPKDNLPLIEGTLTEVVYVDDGMTVLFKPGAVNLYPPGNRQILNYM